MKIVQLINDFNSSSGGAERMVQQLHIGLRAQKLDSHLVGITPSKPNLQYARNLNVSKLYSYKAYARIKEMATELQSSDILHVHLFPAILYASILKWRNKLKAKLYFTEHSTSNRRRNSVLGKWLDKFIYGQIDHIVAISNGTADELYLWQKSTQKKTSVIYNGIPLTHSSQKLQSDNQKICITSVGRLVEAKNYSFLLNVLHGLDQNSYKAVIVGDGPLRSSLEEQSLKLGLQQNVEFVGYQESVQPYLLKADLFVLTSKWEGFGLAALEAMNVGLPVVLSDIPGLNELGNEKNGVYLCTHNQQDWISTITTLIKEQEKRNQSGLLAFQRSLDFSVEKMVNEYIIVYQRA